MVLLQSVLLMVHLFQGNVRGIGNFSFEQEWVFVLQETNSHFRATKSSQNDDSECDEQDLLKAHFVAIDNADIAEVGHNLDLHLFQTKVENIKHFFEGFVQSEGRVCQLKNAFRGVFHVEVIQKEEF